MVRPYILLVQCVLGACCMAAAEVFSLRLCAIFGSVLQKRQNNNLFLLFFVFFCIFSLRHCAIFYLFNPCRGGGASGCGRPPRGGRRVP